MPHAEDRRGEHGVKAALWSGNMSKPDMSQWPTLRNMESLLILDS